MYLLKVITKFDAAHRLGCGYEGPCSTPHGHTWKVAVTLKFTNLKSVGFAEDFKVVKETVKNYISNLDHKFLLPKEDIGTSEYLDKIGNNVIYFYPNPTAEVLGKEIYKWMVSCGYDVDSVEVWETENNCCIYREVVE